ncbi:hypothetical protein [Mesobacillus stamsii]|uniref:Uncharacterized protein n=1 Tax=Mesobacillus stamsii TaxID=225347 RepID=A0ABU0G1C3_9BACI|nr:hypothetical protein [Mesobacillus stamsii]MDQ0415359.1 hypothetical protein [Mesobacillus stamsii]
MKSFFDFNGRTEVTRGAKGPELDKRKAKAPYRRRFRQKVAGEIEFSSATLPSSAAEISLRL